ncbi:hypothetical protein [Nocardioides flavescens]|uniref:DNA-binding beta-propeller fold protein YncE n=1 Tax=Nocardioides flavescens TaxID=2691959 RepID=A0A6L7EY12_9ACTN|nr:hypothetical protein [Nocardioides flavescens]MXG89029.1 hypothetical protein [Nocardioides flavescens]
MNLRPVRLSALLTAAVVAVSTLGSTPPAVAAATSNPSADLAFVTTDPGGGYSVRTLSATGIEATVASGPSLSPGLALDPAGTVYWSGYDTVYALDEGGTTPTAIATGFLNAQYLTADRSGDLHVVDQGAGTVSRIAAGSRAVTTMVPGQSGVTPVAVAVEADGDLLLTRRLSGGSDLVEVPAGGGPTRVVATTTRIWSGVAVAPDSSVWVAETYTPQLLHIDVSTGATLSSVPLPSIVFGPGVDAAGNVYAGAGPDLYEVTAGTSVAPVLRWQGGGGLVGTVATRPARPAVTPLPNPTPDPRPGPDPTPTSWLSPVVTTAKARVRLGVIVVRAEHLVPGEAYEIRLRGRTRSRGTVAPDGTVSVRITLPSRLDGVRRVKVIGSTSGRITRAFEIGWRRG